MAGALEKPDSSLSIGKGEATSDRDCNVIGPFR